MRGAYTDSDTRKQKQIWRKIVTTKTHAKAAVIREIERRLNNSEPEPTRFTFREFATYYSQHEAVPAKFVDDVKIVGKKSWRKIRYDINYLVEYFRDIQLVQIKRTHVKQYRLQRLETPVMRKGKAHPRKLSGVNHELRTLRAMLNVALENDWIEKLPNFKGLISQASENQRENIPTETEVTLILDAVETIDNKLFVKPFVLMLADCGARPIELYTLKWAEVDFEKGLVLFTSDKGKRRTRRTVGLTERAAAAIADLPQNNKFVFGGVKSFKKSWATARKRSGVDIQMYSLRHYYRSRLEKLGVPLVAAMKLLGHQTVDMSQRYTHLSAEDARNYANALENPRNIQDFGEV